MTSNVHYHPGADGVIHHCTEAHDAGYDGPTFAGLAAAVAYAGGEAASAAEPAVRGLAAIYLAPGHRLATGKTVATTGWAAPGRVRLTFTDGTTSVSDAFTPFTLAPAAR